MPEFRYKPDAGFVASMQLSMKGKGDATRQTKMRLLSVTKTFQKQSVGKCHGLCFHKIHRQWLTCNLGHAVVSGMLPQYLKKKSKLKVWSCGSLLTGLIDSQVIHKADVTQLPPSSHLV